MKLGKFITLEKATKSVDAIRLGIDNSIDATKAVDAVVIDNLVALCENVVDPISEELGVEVPFNSMFRSPILNKKLKGAKNSSHIKGEAVDVDLDGKNLKHNNATLFLWIRKNIKFDQLIYEFGDDNSPSWIHVSFSKKRNRGQVLRALRNSEGITKYILI